MPMNAAYRGPAEVPAVIPVFPLPGALLLPRGQMPLNIFEPRYLAMIEAPDLKTRAEILVALTEIELAKSESDGETKLQ